MGRGCIPGGGRPKQGGDLVLGVDASADSHCLPQLAHTHAAFRFHLVLPLVERPYCELHSVLADQRPVSLLRRSRRVATGGMPLSPGRSFRGRPPPWTRWDVHGRLCRLCHCATDRTSLFTRYPSERSRKAEEGRASTPRASPSSRRAGCSCLSSRHRSRDEWARNRLQGQAISDLRVRKDEACRRT